MIVENKKKNRYGVAMAFFVVALVDFTLAGTSPHRQALQGIALVFLVLAIVMFAFARRNA